MPGSKKKSAKAKKKAKKNYVVVSNSSYGRALKGQRIYFEGKKPTRLGDDGRITFGKNILETLAKKFGPRFRWTITEEKDDIVVKYGIAHVLTSKRLLDRLFGENLERSREVKTEIVQRRFSTRFRRISPRRRRRLTSPARLRRFSALIFCPSSPPKIKKHLIKSSRISSRVKPCPRLRSKRSKSTP